MIIERICIRADEVAALLGVDKKQGERKLRLMKAAMGKQKHQYVTFKEFAEYTGLPLGEVLAACLPPPRR